MKFDPRKHHRRSMRLKDFDYAQPGAYFVTLCAWQRECLFGEVVEGEVRLNRLGRIVEEEWERLASKFSNITLDAFVVMPNHVHGIIVINAGATRHMQMDAVNSDQNLGLESGIDPYGSPVPDGGVGATHNAQIVIPSGNPNMHIESVDTHGGSPDQEMVKSSERENWATRHSPTDASTEDRYGQTESGEWVDGSPLQNDGVELDPQNSPTQFGVGATHNMRTMILSGNQPVPIESTDCHGGSPRHMQMDAMDANGYSRIESVDTHGGPPDQEMAKSSERENWATRHCPTDGSAEDRYGQTESGEWVDGSPLQNDGMELDPQNSPAQFGVGATHNAQIVIPSGRQHGPIETGEGHGGSPVPAPHGPAAGSLGAMIGQFKSRVTKRIWAIPEYAHVPIWQRNYYEHIIRNEAEWGRICEYIQNNPLRWDEDQLHPAAPPNPFNRDKQHG